MTSANGITKFINCHLIKGEHIIKDDFCVDSTTGRIVSSQSLFYDKKISPSNTIDLQGRLISPGFIDVQLNGTCGFDFSILHDTEDANALHEYDRGLRLANQGLVKTGVTSYLPTIITQRKEIYHKLIPRLAAPIYGQRDAWAGAESLGVHCEGPFLNPDRNGIHSSKLLQKPLTTSLAGDLKSLYDVYGEENLTSKNGIMAPNIKKITLAPELFSNPQKLEAHLRSCDIVVSAGHSMATYEELVASKITMTTHLFNAMEQPQQRAPGIVGTVLGDKSKKRFYGIIADGVHVHPANVTLAYKSNPEGCILVTDAMRWAGLPDGVYDWMNGERIVKQDTVLILEGTGKIAGSSAMLMDCLNNFISWTETPLPQAIATVTSTPARMLGVQDRKGSLNVGADADFCVLRITEGGRLEVDQVWKFGKMVHERRRSNNKQNSAFESRL